MSSDLRMHLKTKNHSLNISPAELLAVKKDIGEDVAKEKKNAKESKTKTSPAPKPKPKIKLITHDSDSEGTPYPSPLVKKPRTIKSKPVSSSRHMIFMPKKKAGEKNTMKRRLLGRRKLGKGSR